MKKIIYRKFNIDILSYFLTSLIIMSLIVWTIQAVNYFDYVIEDGHGLSVYFFFTFFNLPKLIHRILPFIFFISLFYMILSYETKNELSIIWTNGISKIKFANNIIALSLSLMFFQIIFGSTISPLSQNKAREFLKESNISFFSSLIKEKKFINISEGLTVFINKIEDDGTYSEIFLDDKMEGSKTIYAKTGYIIYDENIKLFKLVDGKIINNEKTKINIFDFDEINYDLSKINSKTITVPKLQEIDTISLLSCFNNSFENNITTLDCNTNSDEIKQELLKRIFKPIYIPVLAIMCCMLLAISKNNAKFSKFKNFLFLIIFFVIVVSETSLRLSTESNLSLIIYLILPFIIFFFVYLIFYKLTKDV
jgi:lipopolysaccharide export system permease protein